MANLHYEYRADKRGLKSKPNTVIFSKFGSSAAVKILYFYPLLHIRVFCNIRNEFSNPCKQITELFLLARPWKEWTKTGNWLYFFISTWILSVYILRGRKKEIAASRCLSLEMINIKYLLCWDYKVWKWIEGSSSEALLQGAFTIGYLVMWKLRESSIAVDG